MARKTKSTSDTPAAAALNAQTVNAQQPDGVVVEPQPVVAGGETGTQHDDAAGIDPKAAAQQAAGLVSKAISDAKQPETASVVTVIGPKRGRWRGGRRFGREPVNIPHDQLSEAELEQLCSDPVLAVTIE
jgi:hypothetical protein